MVKSLIFRDVLGNFHYSLRFFCLFFLLSLPLQAQDQGATEEGNAEKSDVLSIPSPDATPEPTPTPSATPEKEEIEEISPEQRIDPTGRSCSGSKPVPERGCQIKCINGSWVESCEMRDCDAAKPVSEIGCTYECVNGRWRRKCTEEACGAKPVPSVGCEVIGCEDGRWQTRCGGQGDDSSECPKVKPTARMNCDVRCIGGRWIQDCPND